MPDHQGTLQPPASQADEARIRPIPPEDLWERLDAIQVQMPKQTAEGFTAEQYAERYHISTSMARKRIDKLVKSGVLVVVGTFTPVSGGRAKIFNFPGSQ